MQWPSQPQRSPADTYFELVTQFPPGTSGTSGQAFLRAEPICAYCSKKGFFDEASMEYLDVLPSHRGMSRPRADPDALERRSCVRLLMESNRGSPDGAREKSLSQIPILSAVLQRDSFTIHAPMSDLITLGRFFNSGPSRFLAWKCSSGSAGGLQPAGLSGRSSVLPYCRRKTVVSREYAVVWSAYCYRPPFVGRARHQPSLLLFFSITPRSQNRIMGSPG